jgi:hypothetical protein
MVLGIIAYAFQMIMYQMIIIYAALGLTYVLLYCAITIPSAYKYGAAKSRYILIAFIFLFVSIPLVFQTLKITIDLSFLSELGIAWLIIILCIFIIIALCISIFLSLRILKKRNI